MNLRNLLRAALIPIGASLVMRGLQQLRDEADELAELVAARRAYLADEGPLPEVDQPADLTCPDGCKSCTDRGAVPCLGLLPGDERSPEDLPPEGVLQLTPAARFPVRPRHVAAGLAGFGLGWVAVAALRRRAELAATVAALNAARSAHLADQPPAPGSPADLAARRPLVDEEALRRMVEHAARVDEDQADERAARVADAAREIDPYACTKCPYAPLPTRSPSQRGVDLTLHTNRAHTDKLPA